MVKRCRTIEALVLQEISNDRASGRTGFLQNPPSGTAAPHPAFGHLLPQGEKELLEPFDYLWE
jgi:hypothetical protein